MPEFLLNALVGGLVLAAMAGPLGAFVVWRRMAYFGDTLAHSALLGVALGLLLDLSLNLSVIVLCLLVAGLLVGLQRRRSLATDTLLGIMSHGTLALGLIAVTLLPDARIDLMGYLFGDLLAIRQQDLFWIAGGCLVVAILLRWLWNPLLALTVNEELAEVEGVAVGPVRLGLMLLMALVIAVAMKVVGVLLITSLLIVPAASARRLAKTPEQMALYASLLGCLAVMLGLWLSWEFNTPTGPSVVVSAVGLFLASQLVPERRATSA